jgi:hypothetical protein
MKALKRSTGQFIPIVSMVMFTMVVFTIAMVNVYKVSRAKLKVQNLADAAALNLAAQQAQAFNIVVDRNEWMNHMVAGGETPTTGPYVRNENNPCIGVNSLYRLGISCVDNDPRFFTEKEVLSRHIFHSKAGAINYAGTVKTVNDAQKLFVQAYNTFLNGQGGGASALRSNGSMAALLKSDIPELKNDPTIHMFVWNSAGGESTAVSQAQAMLKKKEKISDEDSGASIKTIMEPLNFAIRHVHEAHYKKRCADTKIAGEICVGNAAIEGGELATKYYNKTVPELTPDQYIGYMVPCDPELNNLPCLGRGERMPKINVPATGGAKTRTGVGVYVVKEVNLPGYGYYKVGARAKAYIVEGSGGTGRKDEGNIREIPRFSPTYWVKLAR